MVVALTIRMLTSGVTKTATGRKLLLLNALTGGVAGGTASFLNTSLMRRAEVEKGIKVFEDKECSKEIALSKKCAE